MSSGIRGLIAFMSLVGSVTRVPQKHDGLSLLGEVSDFWGLAVALLVRVKNALEQGFLHH